MKEWLDPIVNTRGSERLEVAPDWICVGAILVMKGHFPYIAEIIGFTDANTPILEFDSDGSIHDYWGCDEVIQRFTPWQAGMRVYDPTGKGRIK